MTSADPFPTRLKLPGVACSVAEARAAVDGLLSHRVLRRRAADASASRPWAAWRCATRTRRKRVRHDKIDSNGKLTLRHNSRLHHLGIGRRHAGKPVLILVHDLDVRVITHTGELLATFVINPERDYQLQPKT